MGAVSCPVDRGSAHGFVWSARAGVVVGSDRSADGNGAMNWRVLSLVRVMHADGPDVSRSAAGRAAVDRPRNSAHAPLARRRAGYQEFAACELLSGGTRCGSQRSMLRASSIVRRL
jgi:hypothetical protein